MLRSRRLLVLALIAPCAPFLAGAHAPASAADETCAGQPATIVGTPGGTVQGTDDADVVVTAGATRVDVGGGDDLVCLTVDGATVLTGDGDDHVIGLSAAPTGADATPTVVELGAGEDRFDGGPSPEVVATHEPGAVEDPDAPRVEENVVVGGGGRDEIDTGDAAQLADDVDVGVDAIVLVRATESSPNARLVGAPGALLAFDLPEVEERWLVSARSTTLFRDGAGLLRWSDFDSYAVNVAGDGAAKNGASHEVAFQGSARDERVLATRLTSADLGAGDDVLTVLRPTPTRTGVSGGAGRDAVFLGATPGRDALRVDLADRTFALDGDRGRLAGFERLGVDARRAVEVRGTAGDDRIRVAGCSVAVAAGAGDDEVTVTVPRVVGPGCSGRAVVDGGTGSDLLVGASGDDVLLGGRGRDIADGDSGRDRCLAEITRRCERA